MLRIKAKEDATVEVIDGSFPLGSRDTLKVIIEDDIIKNYIKTIGTDTCLKQNNIIAYGDFNETRDIQNVDISEISKNTSVGLISGYGTNYSRCLKCATTNKTGSGKIIFNTTNKLSIGKYKFVFYINTNTDVSFYFDGTIEDSINVEPTNNDWKKIVTELEVTNINEFKIFMECATGICYIDTMSLFRLKDEIQKNAIDSVGFRLNFLNPEHEIINYGEDEDGIINYGEDEDGMYVLMYFPPITCVDYQDNLLCNFDVYLTQEPRVKQLGDTYYPSEIEDLIYQSQDFILHGYIVSDSIEDVELNVGKI